MYVVQGRIVHKYQLLSKEISSIMYTCYDLLLECQVYVSILLDQTLLTTRFPL